MSHEAALWAVIAESWAPPPDLRVSEHADRYGMIPPGMSGLAGNRAWSCRPFQRGMLDAFSHPLIRRIYCQKSARVGWTSLLQLAITYWCHHDPRSILCVQPTEEDAREWSKDVLEPVIEDTECLAPLFNDPHLRAASTISQKFYRGGLSIRLRGAHSGRGFRRFTVGGVLADEVDAYPMVAGDEGDQIKLAERRAETIYNAVIAVGSTPLLAQLSRIEKLMLAASVGYYLLPCVHCGVEHVRLFRVPEAPLEIAGEVVPVSHLVWPDGRPDAAHWNCPACPKPITHAHHDGMSHRGRWVGDDWQWTHDHGFSFDDSFAGTIGFKVWSGYNSTPGSTPAALAANWLESKGDPQSLQVFVNTVLGETWEERGEQPSAHALTKRLEDWQDLDVPVEADFLTAMVDVQGEWLELEACAWIRDTRESWSIDHVILPGSPESDETWEDLRETLETIYETPSGPRQIDAIGIDTGFKQDEVMKFIRKHGASRTLPFKGMPGKRPIVESLEDRIKRLRKLATRGERLRPVLVGVDAAKLAVYRSLQVEQPGPRYCHFPAGRSSEYFESLTGERLLTRYRKGFPIREWHKIRERNEALDCRVGNLALCLLMEQKVIPVRTRPGTPRAARPAPGASSSLGLGRPGWNLGSSR